MNLSLLMQIVVASLLGGVLSVTAAGFVMVGLPRRWLAFAVTFSIGVLLATALLHLLPEALESGLTPHEVFPVLLAGILGFFGLEKFANWRHSHADGQAGHAKGSCDEAGHEGDRHSEAVGILVGDAFHNFTDGLLIASAFLSDPALGWATTFAVVAHEVPQEAGDFAILLAAGWQRGRAFFWNSISSLASLLGGLCGFFALERFEHGLPYLLTLAAASFIYIAIADLMPRLRREQNDIGWHGLLLGAGIVVSILASGHTH